MHPSCKGTKENIHSVAFYGVAGSDIFGAPVLPERARCLMHTILSAPLHPILAAFYLDGLPTLITGMNTCATCLGPVLAPMARPHQRVKACGSTSGTCMCPRVQACQCSFCVVFAIVYR